MAGIYIHIPFCKQACHYCDFYFSTNQSTRKDLMASLIEELHLQKDYLQSEPIHTIYLGGGTPSLLPSQELSNLLDAVYANYPVHLQAEVTLEANPDDLSGHKLNELFATGINRLSIGIQSFEDSVLKFFNRAHTSGEASECIDQARAAGFKNVSLDLMYAIPGQDHNTWRKNIDQALRLQPEHISSYTLTIEEKTAFGKWASSGRLKAVEEEFAAEQFEILMGKLGEAGYEQYEISNFSKPGYYSRHNSNYWKQEKYLGIGPSAHSYNGASRQFNVSNNADYTKSIQQNQLPFELELLTSENKINEFIFTSLRTMWGCSLAYLKDHLNYDVLKEQAVYLKNLQEQNLVSIDNQTLFLTHKGKFVADQIASDLFIVR